MDPWCKKTSNISVNSEYTSILRRGLTSTPLLFPSATSLGAVPEPPYCWVWPCQSKQGWVPPVASFSKHLLWASEQQGQVSTEHTVLVLDQPSGLPIANNGGVLGREFLLPRLILSKPGPLCLRLGLLVLGLGLQLELVLIM